MNEELKPCPFCGGRASANGHQTFRPRLRNTKWTDDSPITEAFFVNCMACGISTKGHADVGHRTREEAILRWNRRAE